MPNTSSRGPSGRWPTHTPAYTTPANVVVTSYGALQQEINNGFSGKVIEVNIGPSSEVSLSGGNTSWTKNMLVRPPIGKRGEKFVINGGQNYLQSSHVTFAGFTIAGGAYNIASGNRTTWAWTELSGHPFIAIQNQPNFEWWEASHTTPQFSKSSSDLMQIKTTNNSTVGAYMTGLYFNGAPIDATDGIDHHTDTIQTFATNGGSVGAITIANSVITGADDKSFQIAGNIADFVIDNSYVSGPGTAKSNWPQSQWWPWPGYRLGKYNFAITCANGPQNFVVIKNSDIAGGINSGNAPIKEATNSRFKDFPGAKSQSGVTIDASYNGPPPPRPTHTNLNSIWSP